MRDKIFTFDPKHHEFPMLQCVRILFHFKEQIRRFGGIGVIDPERSDSFCINEHTGRHSADQKSSNQSEQYPHDVYLPSKLFFRFFYPGIFQDTNLAHFSVTCVWKI